MDPERIDHAGDIPRAVEPASQRDQQDSYAWVTAGLARSQLQVLVPELIIPDGPEYDQQAIAAYVGTLRGEY